jgi:hypothetical protein
MGGFALPPGAKLVDAGDTLKLPPGAKLVGGGPSAQDLQMLRVRSASPTQFEMQGGYTPEDTPTSPLPETGVMNRLINPFRATGAALTAPFLHPIQTAQGMGSAQMAGGTTPYGAPMYAPTGNQSRDQANQQAFQSNQQQVMEGAANDIQQHPFYTAGSIAGPMLLGEGVSRLRAPEPPPTMQPQPVAEIPKGSLVQRGARSLIGASDKLTKDIANEAVTTHAEKVGTIDAKNAEAAAIQQAKVAKVQQREQLQQQSLDNSAALAQRVQQVKQAVRNEGTQKYNVVTQAVGDAGVPANDIASLVNHAQENILKGSRPESIKQFRSLRHRALRRVSLRGSHQARRRRPVP